MKTIMMINMLLFWGCSSKVSLWSQSGFSQKISPSSESNEKTLLAPMASLGQNHASSTVTQVSLTLSDGKRHRGNLKSVQSGGIALEEGFIPRSDIAVIRVSRPSRAWHGAAIGFGLGAATGGLLYGAFVDGGDTPFDTSDFVLVTGVFGALGSLPGALIGAAASADKHYDLTGPDAERQWKSFVKKYGS